MPLGYKVVDVNSAAKRFNDANIFNVNFKVEHESSQYSEYIKLIFEDAQPESLESVAKTLLSFGIVSNSSPGAAKKTDGGVIILSEEDCEKFIGASWSKCSRPPKRLSEAGSDLDDCEWPADTEILETVAATAEEVPTIGVLASPSASMVPREPERLSDAGSDLDDSAWPADTEIEAIAATAEQPSLLPFVTDQQEQLVRSLSPITPTQSPPLEEDGGLDALIKIHVLELLKIILPGHEWKFGISAGSLQGYDFDSIDDSMVGKDIGIEGIQLTCGYALIYAETDVLQFIKEYCQKQHWGADEIVGMLQVQAPQVAEPPQEHPPQQEVTVLPDGIDDAVAPSLADKFFELIKTNYNITCVEDLNCSAKEAFKDSLVFQLPDDSTIKQWLLEQLRDYGACSHDVYDNVLIISNENARRFIKVKDATDAPSAILPSEQMDAESTSTSDSNSTSEEEVQEKGQKLAGYQAALPSVAAAVKPHDMKETKTFLVAKPHLFPLFPQHKSDIVAAEENKAARAISPPVLCEPMRTNPDLGESKPELKKKTSGWIKGLAAFLGVVGAAALSVGIVLTLTGIGAEFGLPLLVAGGVLLGLSLATANITIVKIPYVNSENNSPINVVQVKPASAENPTKSSLPSPQIIFAAQPPSAGGAKANQSGIAVSGSGSPSSSLPPSSPPILIRRQAEPADQSLPTQEGPPPPPSLTCVGFFPAPASLFSAPPVSAPPPQAPIVVSSSPGDYF